MGASPGTATTGQGIAQAGAATGTAVVFAGGAWACKTALACPPGSAFVGSSDVTITATLPDGGISDAIFQCVSATSGAPIALAANNTPGTKTVSVAGAPGGGWILGSYVQLQTGVAHLHGSTYQIVNAVAAGPNFTLTFDRIVLYTALAANAQVMPVTTLSQNIRIDARGMFMQGSCSTFIEVQGAMNVTVEGPLAMSGATMPADGNGLIFDTFSVGCTADLVTVSGAGNIQHGFWMIGESHAMTRCLAHDCSGQGFVYDDAAVSVIDDCEAYGCGSQGVVYSSDGGANGAATNEGNVLSHFRSWGNGVGITVTDGASNLTIDACICERNGNGLILDNTQPLGSPSNIKVSGGQYVNNTASGIVIQAGTKGTVIENVDVSGNPTFGISCSDDATIAGVVSSGGGLSGVIQVGGGVVTIDGFNCVVDAATNNPGLTVGGAARVYARGLRFTMNSVNFVPAVQAAGTSNVTCSGVHITFVQQNQGFNANNTAVQTISDVTVDGANVGSSVGVNAASGTTTRIGQRVHMDAAAGPTYNFNSGAHWNRSDIGPGPVTLAGTAGEVVAWPDLQSGDDVMVWLVTPGGTPGPVKVTKNPGTGFTLSGTNAGESSAVNYVVL